VSDCLIDDTHRRKRTKRFSIWVAVSLAITVLVVQFFLVAERNMNQAWPRDLGPISYLYVYWDWPLFSLSEVLHLNLTVFPDDERPLIPIVVSFFYHLPIIAFLFLPILFRERRSQVRFTIVSVASIALWLIVSAILLHDLSI